MSSGPGTPDPFAPFDAVVAGLRQDGLADLAQGLHELVRETAWTTSSEMLGEFRLALQRIESAGRDRLGPATQRHLAAALKLTRTKWR